MTENLHASVTHRAADRGRCRDISLVTIWLNDRVAAFTKLGGKWTATQAVCEFQRNYKKFRAHAAYNDAILLCRRA